MATPWSWLSRPALLRALLLRLRLAWRLLREPAVPRLVKALTLLPLAYVVFPLDVLPDVVPLLGQLDDIGVVLAAVEAFIWLCPTPAVAHHRAGLEAGRPFAAFRPPPTDGEVIDAEFRRG
jgi:uncharacterized membrane protein YkvA (DUF1232 family)